MKYLVRSIKYFFYLILILALVIFALVTFKVVNGDISTMFVNGYDSLWQIACIALVFSLCYPRFGFTTRRAYIKGATEEIAPAVKSVMENHGYELETSEGEDMTFRKRSPAARMLKMWEDRITFTRTAIGYNVEGLTRELARLVSAIEGRFDNVG